MLETAPPLSEGMPLDRGLRALCGIAAYYRIGADPVQLARELALGARAGRGSRPDSRRPPRRPQGPPGRQRDRRAARDPARAGDRARERRADGVRRAQSVGALPARRPDQPRRAGGAARGRRALDRRTGASRRAPDRRRRGRSAPVRDALVPAHHLALSPPARPCAGRLAVRTDFRASRRRSSFRSSSTRCSPIAATRPCSCSSAALSSSASST